MSPCSTSPSATRTPVGTLQADLSGGWPAASPLLFHQRALAALVGYPSLPWGVSKVFFRVCLQPHPFPWSYRSGCCCGLPAGGGLKNECWVLPLFCLPKVKDPFTFLVPLNLGFWHSPWQQVWVSKVTWAPLPGHQPPARSFQPYPSSLLAGVARPKTKLGWGWGGGSC